MLATGPFLAAVLLAPSCPSTTQDTAPPADCGVVATPVSPTDGATDAYYRGEIEFSLSDADDTAEISMDGVAGTSWRSDSNRHVFFQPTDPLSPGTAYTATLSYCSGDATISFTTSDLGSDLAADVTGRTYAMDLQTGRIVIPEDIGDALGTYLEYTVLLGVVSTDGGQIQMIGALPSKDDPNQQDYCEPTLNDFPAADFSASPYFQVGPQDTTLSVAGYDITVNDLYISGTFASDGSYFGGGTLAGQIDTRPLVPLVFDGEEDPGAVCDFIVSFGVSCVPCSDGEPYCLEIKAVDLVAQELPDVVIEPVEQKDCNAQCPDSADNPDCQLDTGLDTGMK